MVVIAGPNGCGKSCVLDAIRLFKSVYGGYQPNEWQQWLGEFQIDFQRSPHQMLSLLRDRSQPSEIFATIELADQEASFIDSELPLMLEDHIWKTSFPGLQQGGLHSRPGLAAELRAHKPAIDKRVSELLPELRKQVALRRLHGKLIIHPTGGAQTAPNIVLEIVFSSFRPKHIGLIDYHGSHRNYGREQLGGINLNLDQEEDRFRSAILYNYANKYANIKSEMAAEFVRHALAEKIPGRAVNEGRETSLSDTLQELFTIFFPGKRFLGPQPTEDGSLSFPVEVEGGITHDINDLSSGEKEVLFGYLRLRNSAPRYSVILLDEPELHLNPALVRGLPQFYLKRLGLELENQIWLVTHSDAFLREAVGHVGLRVFHMQYASTATTTDNQVHEIQTGEETEAVILEMVGDLAAYRPGAKVVFLEGENSEFDLGMVSRLFPAVEKEVNLLSGGNRSKVEALHKTLELSVEAGKIPVKIYSVVDKDSASDVEPPDNVGRHFKWDVYHIENYLLHARFIKSALVNLNIQSSDVSTEIDIDNQLLRIAKEQMDQLVTHKVRMEIGLALVHALDLGFDPHSNDIGADLHKAVERSLKKASQRADREFGLEAIRERVSTERQILQTSLKDGSWKKHFKGREILRAFSGEFLQGMRYEHFRNLIISQMVNEGYQPEGMKAVLDQILAD
jgi:energy-coupling factor transporter ATP-binding protein EcfA2